MWQSPPTPPAPTNRHGNYVYNCGDIYHILAKQLGCGIPMVSTFAVAVIVAAKYKIPVANGVLFGAILPCATCSVLICEAVRGFPMVRQQDHETEDAIKNRSCVQCCVDVGVSGCVGFFCCPSIICDFVWGRYECKTLTISDDSCVMNVIMKVLINRYRGELKADHNDRQQWSSTSDGVVMWRMHHDASVEYEEIK